MLDEIFFFCERHRINNPPSSSACLNLDLPYLFSILFFYWHSISIDWMCHIEWENICGEELGRGVETIHPEAHAYDRMDPPEVFEKKSRRVKSEKRFQL